MEVKRTCKWCGKVFIAKKRLPNIVVFNAHSVDINNVSARKEMNLTHSSWERKINCVSKEKSINFANTVFFYERRI